MADTEDTIDPAQAAELAVAQVAEGLAQIARERARVRPEDWATLFRQVQTMLLQLARHPFVKGDVHAEMLVEAIALADDFEEVDRRVDDFADYALKKLQYNAALKEAATGEKQDVPQHLTARTTTTEVTRAASALGPSGSDFEIAANDKPSGDALKRRGVLRL